MSALIVDAMSFLVCSLILMLFSWSECFKLPFVDRASVIDIAPSSPILFRSRTNFFISYYLFLGQLLLQSTLIWFSFRTKKSRLWLYLLVQNDNQISVEGAIAIAATLRMNNALKNHRSYYCLSAISLHKHYFWKQQLLLNKSHHL